MQQLQLRTYNRAELEELFKTSRTDIIKRSLERAGYTFESAGRDKGYTITITGLPEPPTPFEVFARREFECGPQTNFQGIQQHFFLLFYDPEYQFLPSNHQAKFLEKKHGIKVSNQSLRNWQKLLINRNWIAKDKENVKYYLCRKGQRPREISKKEYSKAWQEFYARLGAGEDANDLRKEICNKYGGMPRKQCGLIENAIERDKLDELRGVLEGLLV